MRRAAGWVIGGLLALGAILGWHATERARGETGATLFSVSDGCSIVVPADATKAELGAAELIRATFAGASGHEPGAFPIVREGEIASVSAAIFVGRTRREADFLRPARRAPFDTAVGLRVRGGVAVVRSERRESALAAAGWFLEEQLGARWFMPGPLGEVVPRKRDLLLAAGERVARPGFISRDLGVGGDAARDWYARNKLEARFHHSHNLTEIFKPEDLRAKPEMAPLRYGRRHFPPAGDYNWQPDMTSPVAIEHAAAAANRAFRADPNRVSFSLSENDAARFDHSARTLERVSPPRFFRTRPDYSDLVFGFANDVAAIVARSHPDRWLPTYAYYWAENTPSFRVAKNVIPYLTADRAQWFDPAFAEEDKRLIERWCRLGPEIVGVYDYFYGAPFLIPRPILTAVKESIPFEHEAGVRAFYAESSPNWALDGPKAWLTAQLLWDPKRDPDALLETYYRELWGEAGEPMRAFFAECDRAWLEQPRPGYWIKYFQDEQQALLFPAERRARLRASLLAARQNARSDEVRARVDFVTAGWNVSEMFIEFCEARDELRATVAPGVREPANAADAWLRYVDRRKRFVAGYAAIQEESSLALAAQKIDIYLRNEPTGQAVRAFLGSELNRQFLEANSALLPAEATVAELARLFAEGRNVLIDPEWAKVARKPIGGSADFEWIEVGGTWQASGEPAERRSIRWLDDGSGPTRLRFDGCRQEFLVQWQPTKPGALYAAEIDVRAKVSPGNQTFLIVNFLDEKYQRLGGGIVDRLPADADVQEARLCVIARAPTNARFVGVGVRVIHQVNDDFAEFSRASLKRLERAATR